MRHSKRGPSSEAVFFFFCKHQFPRSRRDVSQRSTTFDFDEPVLYEMAAKSSWYDPSTILRAGDSNLSGTGDDRSVTDVS